eukprot:g38.t1
MAEDEESVEWVPPRKIEDLYVKTEGNMFSSINRPTAGWRNSRELPRGSAPFQLYSLATPNGWKVGILLEELNVSYDAHIINIGLGEQFSRGFLGANPNSKIPAAIDYDTLDGKPIALMESAAIMIYLSEKYDRFMPRDSRLRMECLQWMFFQTGSQGPNTGNFGHFYVYAPPTAVDARNYGVARYGMEVQRICDVLDRHLSGLGNFSGKSTMRPKGPRDFLVGDMYTVADMCLFPWAYMLRKRGYDRPGQSKARDFLSISKYKYLTRWLDRIAARPAVQRGIRVCHGSPKPWLERKKKRAASRL